MHVTSVRPIDSSDSPSQSVLRQEVVQIIARHVGQTGGFETPVPGLRVGLADQPIPPWSHTAEACFCVLVQGWRTITLGDAVFIQGEQTYLLSTVAVPSIIAIPEASPAAPHVALRIDLDFALARQIITDFAIPAPGSALPESHLFLSQMEPALFDAVARLVRLIEAPGDVAFMSGLLHKEILYRLLSGPAGWKIQHMVRLGSQGNRATKAVMWVRRHFREPLKIRQLADVAGMAESTLHRHFHDLTGLSPIQYQKRLRLHEARSLMLEGLDVGSAALAVGYESATQFIREYRRLFGGPPLRDIKALRVRGGARIIL